MSGPVSTSDVTDHPAQDAPRRCEIEVLEGRHAEVGGFAVRRVLPRRPRRTVGAWCFVDHMGPGVVSLDGGLDIGPHPHIGLQTVTWLLEGAMLHRDSLGSDQVIRPGQLNLMTAGRGVSHAEQTTDIHEGPLHGVQLWVAQPSATRSGEPAFEHHPELPRVELQRGAATVLVGEFGGVGSPARRDTDHVGVDLELASGRTTIALEPSHEYGLVALDSGVRVGETFLQPGHLGYLGIGREEAALDVGEPARLLLLGGSPFPEQLLMWWNYVARTRDEITGAHRDWSSASERFGTVASALARIDVSGPPWSTSSGSDVAGSALVTPRARMSRPGVPSVPLTGTMRIEVAGDSGRTEAVLHGDIDLVGEHELVATLTGLVERAPTLVVDMAGVTFLDSTAIRVLLVVQRTAEQAGTTVVLRAVPAGIRRVLEIAGVDQAIPIIE